MCEKAKWALVVCALTMMGASGAIAQDKVSVEASVDIVSKHVWRGQLVNEDYVFQPGAKIGFGKLSAGAWGSIGLTDAHGRKYEFERMDFFVDWTEDIADVQGVSYSVGFIYYDFPRPKTETTEIYGGLNFDTFLSPSVTYYYGTEDFEGSYVSAEVGHFFDGVIDIAEGKAMSVDVSAKLGWGDKKYNTGYWGVNKGELNDFALSVTLPFDVAGFDVSPSVTYIGLLGADVSDSRRYGSDNSYLVFGMGLSKTF